MDSVCCTCDFDLLGVFVDGLIVNLSSERWGYLFEDFVLAPGTR